MFLTSFEMDAWICHKKTLHLGAPTDGAAPGWRHPLTIWGSAYPSSPQASVLDQLEAARAQS